MLNLPLLRTDRFGLFGAAERSSAQPNLRASQCFETPDRREFSHFTVVLFGCLQFAKKQFQLFSIYLLTFISRSFRLYKPPFIHKIRVFIRTVELIYGSGSARMGGLRCLWRVPKVHLPLLYEFRRIIPRSGFHKHQRYRWVLSSNVWIGIFRCRTCFSDRHRRGICSSGVR